MGVGFIGLGNIGPRRERVVDPRRIAVKHLLPRERDVEEARLFEGDPARFGHGPSARDAERCRAAEPSSAGQVHHRVDAQPRGSEQRREHLERAPEIAAVTRRERALPRAYEERERPLGVARDGVDAR